MLWSGFLVREAKTDIRDSRPGGAASLGLLAVPVAAVSSSVSWSMSSSRFGGADVDDELVVEVEVESMVTASR